MTKSFKLLDAIQSPYSDRNMIINMTFWNFPSVLTKCSIIHYENLYINYIDPKIFWENRLFSFFMGKNSFFFPVRIVQETLCRFYPLLALFNHTSANKNYSVFSDYICLH